MPNRNIEGNYRYGYQGEYAEKEDAGTTGATNSFELRLWDARIGRWLTTDPAGQFSSPYLGMGNNPINGVDPDGAKFFDWVSKDGGDSYYWDPRINSKAEAEAAGLFYGGKTVSEAIKASDKWFWQGTFRK